MSFSVNTYNKTCILCVKLIKDTKVVDLWILVHSFLIIIRLQLAHALARRIRRNTKFAGLDLCDTIYQTTLSILPKKTLF